MSLESSPLKEKQIGDYLIQELIGTGGFAKVYVGMHIPSKERVAIKIIDKEVLFIEEINKKRLLLEISILKKVRHKNVIKLYEIMETPQAIYLVMEYCNTGELFDYIVSKEQLTEKQACIFYQEIIDALTYLHSQQIVHRDIKPENILLDTIERKIDCKIIDFGISRCYEKNRFIETPCGTASYAPPEMHRGEPYDGILSDVWSSGVLLFSMVCGYLPFNEEDEYENIRNIIKGNYYIPEDELSPELCDLLKHLLDINPRTRYNLDQIKEHPWFNIVPMTSRPGITIGYHRIPIDEKIIKQCELYGYNKDEVIESVKNNRFDKNSAVYYIILKKFEMQGIESISDLFSEKYLDYINDKNNILSEEEINLLNDEKREENEIRNLNQEFENIKNEKYDKNDSLNEIKDNEDEDLNNNKNNESFDEKKDNEDEDIINNKNNESLDEIKNNEEEDIINNKNNESLDEIKNNEDEDLNRNNNYDSLDENKDKNLSDDKIDENKKERKESLEAIVANDDLNNKEMNLNEEFNIQNLIESKNEKEINTSILENENKKEKENLEDNNEDKNKDNNEVNEEVNNENNNEDNHKDKNTDIIEDKNYLKEKNNDELIEKSKEKEDLEDRNENRNELNNEKENEIDNKYELDKKEIENEKVENENKEYIENIEDKEKENKKIEKDKKLIKKDKNKNNEMNETPNKLMPFNSFFIGSNILNENKEEENDKNILNTSFTIKLTDNIKENILKMKNPKKKEINKNKIKKALKELKKEKMKEKPKKKIALRNIKFEKKENILSRNKKDITIIKNRNASVCLDKRRRNRNIDDDDENEKDNIKKDINNSTKKTNKNRPYIKKTNKSIKEFNTLKNNNIKKNDKSNNNLSKKKKKIEIGHIYLKTDVNIEKKMKRKINIKENIEKRNNIRKSRNDRNNDLNNNLMSINLYKRNKSKKEDLYSSFIERKNKRNKNDSYKKRINNSLYSYNTNYDIKERKNKKNELENSCYIKKKIYSTANKNDRKNKSIGLRKRIKPRIPELSIINKKLNLSLDKSKTNIEREKNKRKIKIDTKNRFNGPLEIKNLIVSNTVEYIHDIINKTLHKNQIKFSKLNPYKYSCCSKSMDKFFIEIYYISKLYEYNDDTIKKNEILENSENDEDKRYLFYLKLLLSNDINEIPNSKLLEKVINDIQSRIKH